MKFNEAEWYENCLDREESTTFELEERKWGKSHSWQNFIKALPGKSNLKPINCIIQFNVALGMLRAEEAIEREGG